MRHRQKLPPPVRLMFNLPKGKAKTLPAPKDLEEIEAELLRTQEELAQLRERQEFVEALLTGTRTPPALATPAATAAERELA